MELIVKGGYREVTGLNRRAVNIVKQAIRDRDIIDEDFLFANPKTDTRYHHTLCQFKKTVGRLGLKVDGSSLQFHDFRRNFGTRTRQGGVPVDDLQSLMMHRDGRSAERNFHDERLAKGHLVKNIPSLEVSETPESWHKSGTHNKITG